MRPQRQTLELIVNQTDFKNIRWVTREEPRYTEPDAGQVLVEVEKFALTANNITYMVFGDTLHYWDYFPAPEAGFGRVPVWGYGRVMQSRHEAIAEGERLYGYFPIGSHLLMQPERVKPGGFIDAMEHRQELMPAYNHYVRTDHEPRYQTEHEALQAALRPLFITSYLAYDMLQDNDYYGARRTVILSASSKTAITLAACIKSFSNTPVETIGLTSEGNRNFVESLDCYDSVFSYQNIDALPADRSTLLVDVSGNRGLLESCYRVLGDKLVFTSLLGASHWQNMNTAAGELPGVKPRTFLAPHQIKKRIEDWGPEAFDRNLAEAWAHYEQQAARWFRVSSHEGITAIETTYHRALAGDMDPQEITILSCTQEAAGDN